MKSSKRKAHYLRLREKIALLTLSSCTLFMVLGTIFYFQFGKVDKAQATAAGDFRTRATGNWNSLGTWSMYNGASWINATILPNSGNGSIEIMSGNTVTITSTVTADQLVIHANGAIAINNGKFLNIVNGSGTDLTVDGTLTIKSGGTLSENASATVDINDSVVLASGGTHVANAGSTVNINANGIYINNGGTAPTASGIWTVKSGAIYRSAKNGEAIPLATWNSGSSLEITGITTTAPTNMDQVFYNLTWNCPSQAANINLGGSLTTIDGDFNINNTNGSSLELTNSIVYTLAIGGDLNIGSGSNAAQLDLESGGVNCTVNLTGNMSIGSSGTMIRSGSGVAPVFCFNNSTATQTFTSANSAGINSNGRIDWRVGTGSTTNTLQILSDFPMTNSSNSPNGMTVYSGSTLDCGTYIVSGPSAKFILNSGSAILLGSTNGISSSGATGNIQVTGTRSFSTSADYTYDGSATQITGSGLPASVNDLTVNNSNHLTLTNTVTVNGNLSLVSGQVITGANEMVVANTATSSISGYSSTDYVRGNLRRYVNATGSYDFPIGTSTHYEFININFSGMAGFTNLLGSFTNASPIKPSYPMTSLTVNSTFVDTMLNYGYWVMTPNSAMTSGSYIATLKETGYTNPASSPSNYCVLKRASTNSYWQSLGTHNNNTQSEVGGVVTAVRSALTSFSHFGIGKYRGIGTLPINLISFDAKYNGKVVNLSWSTSSEINNDYFTVERSTDGLFFDEVLRKPGAGNSSRVINYSEVDPNPLPEFTYYRLKQTDYDGHYIYSEIKTVKYYSQPDRDASIKLTSVGPNPFNDKFTVSFVLNSSSPVDFQLVNSSGQIVYKEKFSTMDGTNQYIFKDDQDLPAGIYFMNMVYNGQKIVQRIVKN